MPCRGTSRRTDRPRTPGAESGDQWRVHFAPDETGELDLTWRPFARAPTWRWIPTPMAGTSAGFMDGTIGQFTIAPTDKTGRDHRGKGRLDVVGHHHLRFARNRTLLPQVRGRRPGEPVRLRRFRRHPQRRTTGARVGSRISRITTPPTPPSTPGIGGKGTELLGAIRYLADKGMNAFSFLTFNVDGDDDNVFPHRLTGTTAHYEALADNQRWANNGVYKDRMDVSKLGPVGAGLRLRGQAGDVPPLQDHGDRERAEDGRRRPGPRAQALLPRTDRPLRPSPGA